MKTITTLACAVTALALLLPVTATAQVSKDGMGKVLPVELYICNYRSGKGAADLDRAVSRWNAYMDERDTDTYLGMTLTPVFFGTEQDFDLIWMGVFADGNAMGSGLQEYMANGGAVQAAFNAVVDCNAHVLMSSAMYKAPAQTLPDNNAAILTMMDCKLNEGHRYADIKAAEMKWAAYLAESGSPAGFWHWFPTFGGGAADFDYKVTYGYRDMSELGAQYERDANGGGREASQEIFGDIDECDEARVYAAQVRRQAQVR